MFVVFADDRIIGTGSDGAVICSIIDMTIDEESQPGSDSVDQDDSNVLDLESILDKYFLLTADRQYNIVDVLPSSTSITICSSNIAMD